MNHSSEAKVTIQPEVEIRPFSALLYGQCTLHSKSRVLVVEARDVRPELMMRRSHRAESVVEGCSVEVPEVRLRKRQRKKT
jgi:hypothetical protein